MRPPIPEEWGTRLTADMLREWRRIRRVSQTDLARVLGVTQTTITNWERRVTDVPPYLHLALESVDRRLNFFARPPEPKQGPPRRAQLAAQRDRERLAAQLAGTLP